MMRTLTLAAILESSEIASEILEVSPTLHDSEIVKLAFERKGPTLTMTVVGPAIRPFPVTMQFAAIADVELTDFNHQNVISSVSVEEHPDANREGSTRFEVEFDSVFGAILRFTCSSAKVLAWKPQS